MAPPLLLQSTGGIYVMEKIISLLVLSASLAACASPLGLRGGDQPSASPGEGMQLLAGHWRGSIGETAGWYYQGLIPLDLTIAPDGTWSGTVGQAQASGTARVQRGQVVLTGTTRTAAGRVDPLYLRLTGDEAARWGATRADFPGGDTHASVSLRRAS
jgi:hypothetical protein